MIDIEHPFLKDAYEFARDRYLLKKLEHSDETYFQHVMAVYFHVYSFTKDIDVRVASILYELLNIKRSNKEEIARHFNPEIADYVSELALNRVTLQDMGETDYMIMKCNRVSPESLIVLLSDRLNRIHVFPKLKKDFIDKNPDYCDNYCADTEEILSGIKADRLNTEHELLIDRIHHEIEKYYKNKNKQGEEDDYRPPVDL